MHGSYRTFFPVFSYFSKIFLFSSFFPCFLLFLLFFLFFLFFFFFSSKNFEFSGISLHRTLIDPGKPGKPWKINQFYQSQGKVRDFFILKAVCMYFLSFLRMINFFFFVFLLIFCMYTLLKKAVLRHHFTFTSFFA